MGQLDSMVEYLPAAWLERGILYVQPEDSSSKTFATRVLEGAAFLAIASAFVLTTNLVVPTDAAVGWPPTVRQQSAAQTAAALNAIGSRIDAKLSRFLIPDQKIDPVLLSEARLTLSSIKKQA